MKGAVKVYIVNFGAVVAKSKETFYFFKLFYFSKKNTYNYYY